MVSVSGKPLLTASQSLGQLLESLNREQRRNQELLASLAFALRSFTNPGRFLELIPLITRRLVEAEGALLVSFHPDGRLWREQIHLQVGDRAPELMRQLVTLSDDELAALGGSAAVAERLDQLVARLMSGLQMFGTSVVCRGRERGRLYVFNRGERSCWSDVHRRHVQLVADLSGVALENDTLVQLIRGHERLDRELSIGAEIQAQLLPDRCPVIEGVDLAACCRPASQVGGDYYDFIPTRPQLQGRRRQQGRWALVIGDVMGKGVPASLLMTLLRGMLRAGVLGGHAPDRILRDLNRMALQDLAKSHRFVTLFYSDYDPRSRLLRYANAAHNPPLLWRRRAGRVERLDAPGMVIGLQSEADYRAAKAVLEPGDVLLCYTDGVTDALGFSGERFDEARLTRALGAVCRSADTAQDILEQLFVRLDRFVGSDRRLEDDASLVVLKVREHLMLPTLPGERPVSLPE
ncbi:MAG: PP2C family protein-serine/threonine phosphatase [Cyanobacteriota bacterium]|nr:PP2C family protein-serine/threonine phosphatase [Cyanobacteriota bacterium]